MKTLSILLAATALITVAACSKKEDADRTEASTSITLNTDDESGGTVDIQADSETGNMELKLPGGFEAKFKVPGGLPSEAKFDIDGVGLYPGAKVHRIKINAQDKDARHDATVVLGFKAPADPAAVADWYQQQFEDKKVTASRSGETLTGKTEDGDDFTLGLAAGAAGMTEGTLTIRSLKKA